MLKISFTLYCCLFPLFYVYAQHDPIYLHTYDNEFVEAYRDFPSVPRGVLEAVAYTNTRMHHLVPNPDPVYRSCMGLPLAYGVMGLVADGKGWFRNNLVYIAQLSGYRVEELQQSAQIQIRAFAAAFVIIQQQQGIGSTVVADNIEVLRLLSELPYERETVQHDFAMNSHLYSVLYHLNLPAFQQEYGLPNYKLDLEMIFGAADYALVSAKTLDLSNEYSASPIDVHHSQNEVDDNLLPADALLSVCAMPDGPVEYSAAVAFDAPSDNYSGVISPYLIAIHDIEGTYAGAISWFNNPASDVSAHYCMRSFDGQVTQMVCHRRKAWHVGAENPYAVGIEHEGYAAQGEAWYSKTMYQTSADLARFIADDLGINKLQTYDGLPFADVQVYGHTCHKIKGHQMFINNNHSDPGLAWDWPYYYTLINDLPVPTVYTAASGMIYDSGGSAANYADEQRVTWRIEPSGAVASSITLSFSSYAVENDYDYLWIYDGTDNSGALIGKYSGISPATVTAYSGAMFLEFRSDCSTTMSGWAATYTSSTAPVACLIPTDLSLNIAALSCVMNWDNIANATSYEVSWNRSLDTAWITETVDSNSYVLTGLTAGAAYECRVRAICGSGIYSGYAGEAFVSNDIGMTTTVAGDYAVNQCEGDMRDSGGASWHYANNENWVYTINPTGASSITLVFSSFDLEVNYDFLYVYDGNSTAAPLIGTYTGTNSPNTIVSSGGALTLRFTSDNSTTRPGWVADWTCVQPVVCIPNTSIGALSEWQTDDFSVNFTDIDACMSGSMIAYRLVSEYKDNNRWVANTQLAYLNETADADSLSDEWTSQSGTWTQSNGNIIQNNVSNTNTNLYTPLIADNTSKYLIHFRMKIGGTGTNRRAGLHFFCSDPTQTQRGNSYMVYFRVDNDKVQIYEAINNTIGSPKTDDTAVIDPNTWYDCKIMYDPQSGLIRVFLDNVLVSQWTSATPHQTGSYISLRSAECIAEYDFIRSYKSSSANMLLNITVGNNAADMIRYENANPMEDHCQISSIILDNGNKWSDIALRSTRIDRSVPTVVYVNDGTSIGIDIDQSNDNSQMAANWTLSTDINSGIIAYEYGIGTTAGSTNVIAWTDNGIATSFLISGLNLDYGLTYYIAVRARNGAGLYSDIAISDGITLLLPCYIPNQLTATTTSNSTILAQWTAANNAQAYNIRYKIQNNSNWTTINDIIGISINIDDLMPCTVYEIQVQTQCNNGLESGYSASTVAITDDYIATWIAPAPIANCETSLNLNSLLSSDADVGGLWSGMGVSGAIFNPSGLSAGNYNITYSIGIGVCAQSQSHNITVLPSPSAEWVAPLPIANCEAGIDLTNFLSANATSGGLWSGNGISGTMFNPAGLSAGNYSITYSVGAGLCQRSQSHTITVLPSPSAEWVAPTPIANCSTNIDLTNLLSANATSGGLWSGVGVSGSAFNPMGLSAGNYLITYSVGAGLCQRSESHHITVNTCVPSGIRVLLRLWLEGAYQINSQDMTSQLSNSSPLLLPLSQPYNVLPWSYSGTETLSINNIPLQTTDWILIELRHADTGILIAQKAALLQNNGMVYNTWGGEGVYFDVPSGDYTIVVRHRNHLSIASSAAISLPNIVPYDFGVASNILGGADQASNVHNNGTRYALSCGDMNANGIINFADAWLWYSQNTTNNAYLSSDINLDGSIDIADYIQYRPNLSKIGIPLLRY